LIGLTVSHLHLGPSALAYFLFIVVATPDSSLYLLFPPSIAPNLPDPSPVYGNPKDGPHQHQPVYTSGPFKAQDATNFPVSLPVALCIRQSLQLTTYSTATKEGFVVLEVGPQKQHYHLHKALLVHHSDYFRSAMNGSWKEAEDELISLKDVETIAVEIFIHWLYTQQILNTMEVEEMQHEPTDDDPAITGYTKAFVFGARFLVPRFRHAVHNRIVDTLLGENGDAPRNPTFFTATKYALENLPSNHNILKLLLDMHCRYWNVSRQGECLDKEAGITKILNMDLPYTLLIRMVAQYSSRAMETDRGWWKWNLKSCDYHGHLNNQEGKDCKRRSRMSSYLAC
jgi:hypothetical protein